MDEVAIQLENGTLAVVAGQSGAGKTKFIQRVIDNADALYKKPFRKIMYCYLVWQSTFDQLQATHKNIEFVKGIPSCETLDAFADDQDFQYLLILDDLQSVINHSREVLQLVTVFCHHKNIACFILLQALFNKGPYARTIVLQSQYLILMRSMRDVGSMAVVSRQIFGPQKHTILPEVWKDVSKQNSYPYLLVDLTAHTDDKMRLRTNIFPNEIMTVYDTSGS